MNFEIFFFQFFLFLSNGSNNTADAMHVPMPPINNWMCPPGQWFNVNNMPMISMLPNKASKLNEIIQRNLSKSTRVVLTRTMHL